MRETERERQGQRQTERERELGRLRDDRAAVPSPPSPQFTVPDSRRPAGTEVSEAEAGGPGRAESDGVTGAATTPKKPTARTRLRTPPESARGGF